MAIKNVIFDVGNVLVAFRYKDYIRDLGGSEEVVRIIDEEVVKGGIWNHLDEGKLPKEEVFDMIKKYLPGNEAIVDKIFDMKNIKDIIYQYDYTEKLMEQVKAAGLNIYILSNYPDWMWDYHEKEIFTFPKYADGIVVSGKVKMIKPNHDIYQYILDTYNLDPDQCLFFDDREDNIQGACDLGIHGHVFTGYEDCRKIIGIN